MIYKFLLLYHLKPPTQPSPRGEGVEYQCFPPWGLSDWRSQAGKRKGGYYSKRQITYLQYFMHFIEFYYSFR